MTPNEYKQMMQYLTRKKTKREFPKEDTIRLPVTKYDTPPTPLEKKMIDAVFKYDDVKAEDQIVQYDSVTGLFTNKKKDIAFKDAKSARIHNDMYEKYVPEVQKKKEFVRPKKEIKPFIKVAKSSVVSEPSNFKIDPTPSRLPSHGIKKQPSEEERRFMKMVEDDKKQKLKELRSGIGGLLLGWESLN